MTPHQKKLARHALGLPNRNQRSYRNRYITSLGTPEHQVWCDLVEAKMADFRWTQDLPTTPYVFWLTRDGAEAALEPGESLDPWDFPPITPNA